MINSQSVPETPDNAALYSEPILVAIIQLVNPINNNININNV